MDLTFDDKYNGVSLYFYSLSMRELLILKFNSHTLRMGAAEKEVKNTTFDPVFASFLAARFFLIWQGLYLPHEENKVYREKKR
jgi:hypothetical protein